MTLALFTWLWLSAQAAKPYYVCTSGKTTYSVELEPRSKALVITEGGRSQRVPLAGPDTVLARLDPSGPQLYFQENPEGKTPYTRWNFGTSVRIHYTQKDGGTEVTLSLVKDFRDLTDLNCRTSRFKAKVVPLSSTVSLAERVAEPILLSVDLRTQEGELTPVGVMGVESAVRRFFNASPTKSQKDLFFQAVSRPIHRVSSVSMGIIARRLPPETKKFWDELIQGTRYNYYPKVQRYVDWIHYGFEHSGPEGWDSVLAGMWGFGRSAAFEVKDFREFFSRELSGKIDQKIVPGRMFLVLERIPPKRHGFFLGLWKSKQLQFRYARLKSVYEQYARPMIQSLTSPPVRKKGQKPRRSFSEFTRAYHLFRNRPVFDSPENRALIATLVAPYMAKLTEEELADLAKNYLTANPDFFFSMRSLATKKDK